MDDSLYKVGKLLPILCIACWNSYGERENDLTDWQHPKKPINQSSDLTKKNGNNTSYRNSIVEEKI